MAPKRGWTGRNQRQPRKTRTAEHTSRRRSACLKDRSRRGLASLDVIARMTSKCALGYDREEVDSGTGLMSQGSAAPESATWRGGYSPAAFPRGVEGGGEASVVACRSNSSRN